MNTNSGSSNNEDDLVLDDGSGDWPQEPQSNSNAKLIVLGIVLLVILGVGGLWAWRTLVPVDHRARALAALEEEDYAAAVVDLKTVIKKNPDDAEMRWFMGRAYLQLKQPTYAAEYLQEAFDLGYYEPPLLLALARSKLLMREYDDALKLYREWSDVESNVDAAAWEVVRGRSLLNLGRQEKAVEAFLQALRLDPGSTQAKWGLAHAGVGASLEGLSGDEIERALSTGLDEPETWILRGELELSQGNFKDSRAAFEKAVEQGPTNVYALCGLVRILIATNQLDDAKEPIAVLAREHPFDPMSAYVRALYAKERRDYEHALATLDVVFESESNHAMSVLLLGEVQYAMGSMELALDNLGLFHRMVPNSVLGRKRLANALIETGLPERAVALLEPLVDQVHKDPEIASILALAYARMGDKRRAKAYQSLSLKLDGEGAGSRIALQQLGSGDASSAAGELNKVVDLNPEQVESRIMLAISQMRSGDIETALKTSNQLLVERPDDPQIQYLYGSIVELSGDKATATRYYQRTLELDPNYSMADMGLARIEMDSGQRDAAKTRIAALLDRDPANVAAKVWLAQMSLQDGNTGDAISLLESARGSDKASLQPRLILADLYLRQRSVDNALAVSREIVAMSPNHPVGRYLLANAQVMAGNPREGLQMMRELEETNQDNLKLKWRIVEALEQTGDNEALLETLQRIVAVDETNQRALVKLAKLERMRGNSPAAAKLAAKLTEYYPDSGVGVFMQGELMMDDGSYLLAADFLGRAFAMNPDSVTVSRYYMALSQAGEYEKAKQVMSDWLDDNPADSVARLAVADEADRRGDTSLAVSEYEWVIQRQPENVPVLVLLADGYRKLGDRRDLKTAQKAFELAPDDIYAKHMYAWLMVDTGLSERGAKLLRDVVTQAPDNGTFHYHLAVALNDSGSVQEAGDILQTLMRKNVQFAERDEAIALMSRMGVPLLNPEKPEKSRR